MPAILGMNFQTVSVAEKVDSPEHGDQGTGRHLHGGSDRARRLLARHDDAAPAAGQRVRLRQRPTEADGRDDPGRRPGLLDGEHHHREARTVPQDPLELKRIADGPIIDAINAAWTAQTGDQNEPDRRRHRRRPVAELPVGQDEAAANFVKAYLWNHSATAVLYSNDGTNRGTEQVAHSGLAKIYAGHQAAKFFGVPYSDPRYPDVFGRVQVASVYTGGYEDRRARRRQPRRPRRAAARLRARDGLACAGQTLGSRRPRWHRRSSQLLGLNPNALKAVQEEGTKVLPGVAAAAPPGVPPTRVVLRDGSGRDGGSTALPGPCSPRPPAARIR